MPKEADDEMTETARLLRNPANAERLVEAVDRARRGEFEQRDLIGSDEDGTSAWLAQPSVTENQKCSSSASPLWLSRTARRLRP